LARPFRYTFILASVAAGTALAAVGGWRFARASAPVSGPIILVSIDSLRADHLPVYGYQAIKTPAIDALSADGVVFDHAYSHAPLTLPAHASLLSGRLPFETGVRGTSGFTVDGSERMLAEVLADRGYETGAVVSSFELRKETGIDQGFTFFDAELPPPPPGSVTEPLERDGALSERTAERWLESIGTPRAFLFLHLVEPHKPYAPPARFAEYAPYDGEIAYTDEIIGRLVRYLKTHQLYDQSTIILVSDHGEGLGDHGEQEHGLFVHGEAVRVALIVKPAAGQGVPRRVADLVQHIDLVPTILDLAKAPLPGGLRGQSLKPLLDGTGRLEPRVVYAESMFGRYQFGWSGFTSVTDGRYRLIRSTSTHEELYDLELDASERTNVAEESRDARIALTAALDELLAESSIPQPADVSAEDRRRYEALGDVGAMIDPPLVPDGLMGVAVLETYRAAVDHDVAREWPKAIDVLQQLLRFNPTLADAWMRLGSVAERSGRYELALDAYRRLVSLRPDSPDAHLGTATALRRLRRLDEAWQQGQLALSLAAEDTLRVRASAHELLARIAVGRRDQAAARAEAELAEQVDKSRPIVPFIEGRLLQDRRRWSDALAAFERAAAHLEKREGRPFADLHFLMAETLVRLGRQAEAEYYFLEELKHFPLNIRARAELASLYHAAQRSEEASAALAEMVRVAPTPESFVLAARMAQSFGNPRQATSFRSDLQRLSSSSPVAH
jgi:arylsulfatase A-like enzyme/cytochrome c-type biogenesis protein CcmH/NrfG